MKREWLELLEANENIYIYGAGKIGKKILRLIRQGDQLSRVKGFLVSDKAGNPDNIENIPVFQIDEVENKDELILLSVTDIYQEEILSLLSTYGYKNVISAYKFSFLALEDDTDGIPDTIVIDVRELMLQQYIDGEFNRFDIIVRLLAVENFYRNNDYGFRMYEKMQEKRVREGYSSVAVKRFKALIDSFEQKKYDGKSEIIVDSNLRLIDGAHRMALAIYHKIPNVKIRIDKCVRDINYGIEWFQQYFLLADCKILEDKLMQVSAEWMRPIKGIIWPSAMSYKDEIRKYIDGKFRVLSYKDYEFPKEIFIRFVKGVYQIDDIADWKVNSKLKHLVSGEKYHIRVMDIDIKYPEFRVKKYGKTISRVGEDLKKDVREKFKNSIDNYYYDIIFHSADNYYQSWYLDALLASTFSLRPFFKSINTLDWMLIKTENDYFPANFPDSYALYKDIDMITTGKDAEVIRKRAIAFLENYQNQKYQIKLVSKKTGYLIRLELEGFLIFQIDISFANEYLNEEFINRSLDNRIKKDDYYIASMMDECLYRFADFMKNPNKKWHLEYILSCFKGKQ